MHDETPMTPPAAGTILNRELRPADLPAVKSLHALVFGPGRFARSAYRVRERTPPLSRYCSGAFLGEHLIASLRLTPVTIGGAGRHLLLGPLAVDPNYAGHGFGKALIAEALEAATADGIGIVVLVGDQPYYGRFGFAPVPPGQITFPGPVNPARILARETTPGTLATTRGAIAAAQPSMTR